MLVHDVIRLAELSGVDGMSIYRASADGHSPDAMGLQLKVSARRRAWARF
jgi:hypothetical protein